MILKFEKTKISGIDGRTYTIYTEKDSQKEKPFQMVASPSGISFKGDMERELTNHNVDMQDFARQVGEIWKEHLRLKPKIYKANEQ